MHLHRGGEFKESWGYNPAVRSPRGIWEGPGDRMSVRDGLMALHGNPPTPSLVSFCSFGGAEVSLLFYSVYKQQYEEEKPIMWME